MAQRDWLLTALLFSLLVLTWIFIGAAILRLFSGGG